MFRSFCALLSRHDLIGQVVWSLLVLDPCWLYAKNGKMMQVDYEEDGSGAGGYAKEMSDGWKEVRT